MKKTLIQRQKSLIKSALSIICLFLFFSLTFQRKLDCWICTEKSTKLNETIDDEELACNIKLILKDKNEALYIIQNTNTTYEVKYQFKEPNTLIIGDKSYQIKEHSDTSLVLIEQSSSALVPSLIKYSFSPCDVK